MKQNKDRITKAKTTKSWDSERPMNTNTNNTKLGQALIKINSGKHIKLRMNAAPRYIYPVR